MKAMVLAAGLGTRLKPITFEIPKPMVPVLDRPVMAHIVNLLNQQGFDDLIANLHYFPNSIKNYFGDTLTYSYEEELLGTAGGVRNVADFFGDDPIVIISGDALTDIDLRKLVERHTLGRRDCDADREEGARHARVRRGHPRRRRAHPGLPGEARSRRGAVGSRQLRHLRLQPRDLRLLPGAAIRRLGAGRLPRAARERRPVLRARDRRVLERRRLAARAPVRHLRRARGQAEAGAQRHASSTRGCSSARAPSSRTSRSSARPSGSAAIARSASARV